MRKSTIIRFVKNNIERYGSLFCRKAFELSCGCMLCWEADKRFDPNNTYHYGRCRCVACPLWDYIPTNEYSCGWISYKGETLNTIDFKLRGNKPALRALLNGLIKHFDKED